MSDIVPQDLNMEEFKEYLDKAGVLEFLNNQVTVSAVSQDLGNKEFKEYLDKAGVLEFLTLALVKLYEEPEKPSDALEYIKNCTGGAKADKEEINKLSHENQNLKKKIEELKNTEAELKEKLMEATTLTASKTKDKKEEMGLGTYIVTKILALFPDELLDTLFSFLSRHDRKSAAMVCKRWNTIGEGPHFWTWVKFLVTSGNLADMPEILGLSRLAKVEEITLEIISEEVLLAMEKHEGLKLLKMLDFNASGINSDLLARVFTGMEEVRLDYTDLDEKHWNAIFNSMSNGAKLKKLVIYGISLCLANPQLLAEAISTLEMFKLYYGGLTTRQSKAMFDLLAVKSRLKTLQIGWTDLSSVAEQSLATVVSQVEEATFRSARLTIQQWTAIFMKATEENCKLKTLMIRESGRSGLSQVDANLMATAVHKLEKLDLHFADLNAGQYSAIFGMATGNSKLKDLFISYNDLSSVNPHDIAKAVCNMEKIDLGMTKLTNEQCNQIFKYAEKDSNLKVLNIQGNNLGSVETASIAKTVRKIEECNLAASKLTVQQLEAIFKELNEDCKLKKLNLWGIPDLRSVQTSSLVGALGYLETVELSWGLLTPEQVAALESMPEDRKPKGLWN